MTEQPKRVGIEYTVYLADGSEIDSNVGEAPLTFSPGTGDLLPALEEELAELKVGDRKRVTLSPERAYGEIEQDAFHEVDAGDLPEEARTVGAELVAEDDEGNERPLRIHEIKGEKVVLDFNHPLAGQTLTFDLHVVDVKTE